MPPIRDAHDGETAMPLVFPRTESDNMRQTPRNPLPTVDIIIEIDHQIVLIRRRNPPLGWALPGGFVDYGESLETAAVREAREETGLEVELLRQLHTYSDPDRDPRHHTVTTVFIARGQGVPRGADDAMEARLFSKNALPSPIVFDHGKILDDYFCFCGESRPQETR